ncbi:DUF4136 domain-containing protein [Altericroceibacterium xinjiangense]|uniref:DUF4136 domain-containing protein n=1 Tax=Altericroceibacterium xinjiangense TaxID=762261 RepID=UPI000F7F9F0E|nr:DUF4136 domain-containing protein [Altericroceibacterium xinjiangense]
MKHFLLPLAAFALLGGCATNSVSPVEVTRFAAPQAVLGQGTIAVRPVPGIEANSLEFSTYAGAVAAELARLGYTVVQGNAPQVAEIGYSRFVEQGVRDRSPVTVGGGASTGTFGSGVGLGVGIDLSGPPPARLDNELRVLIRPASGGTALWEGRARFSATANSDYSNTQAAANRLAGALFTGFPGESGQTIEVR